MYQVLKEEEEDERRAEDENESFYNARNGKQLDPLKVREAREEEMIFVREIGVYDEVDLEECFEKTGRAPVSTKWVDVNKGTDDDEEIRCRWVARDFKPKGEKDRCDLFAAMPPLEAKKLGRP